MNKKIFFTIAIIVLILTGVSLLTNWVLKPSSQKTLPLPTLPPAITVVPSSRTEMLQLVSVSPKEDLSIKRLPVQEVAFQFNLPIDPGKFFYSVSPTTQTGARQGDSASTIIISPTTIWNDGITIIKILQEAKSIDGKALGSEFIYKLNTKIPESPYTGDY